MAVVQSAYNDLMNISDINADSITIASDASVGGNLAVAGNTTLSSIAANKLLLTSSASVVSPATLATSTGMVTSILSNTFTVDTPQDLQITANPTFVSITTPLINRNLTIHSTTSTASLTLTETSGSSSTLSQIHGTGTKLVDPAGNFLLIGAGSVSTSNNTLDNGSGVMTVKNIIDSALTASTLLACGGTKQVQSATISNANGCNASYTSGIFTVTMTQNLATTGTPTFANIIDSGLTATSLIGSNASKQLQSLTLSSTTGIAASVAGAILSIDTSQDLRISATPTFANIIDSGLTATSLVGTDVSKQLQSLTLSSTTGITASVTGSTFSIDTSQDIRTSATPTFANIIDSGLTATSLLGSNASKQLQSLTLATTTGIAASVVGSTFTIDTPQDLRTSASAMFFRVDASSLFYAPTVAASTNMNTPMINLQATSNQLVFTQLSGNPTIVNCPQTTSLSAIYNIPDVGSAADFFMTSGNQTASGTKTLTAAPIISALNASTLVGTDGSKKLQSITIANTLGCNFDMTGSTLNCKMLQDLTSTGIPTFTAIFVGNSGLAKIQAISWAAGHTVSIPDPLTNCSVVISETNQTINGTKTFSTGPIFSTTPQFFSLAATKLLATDGTGLAQTVTLANSNGCNTSFAGSTLTSTMTQNLSTTGSPSFALTTCSNSCFVRGTSVTTVGSGGFTVLAITSQVLVDPSAMFDGTSKITVSTTGVYKVTAQIRLSDHAVAAADSTGVSIYKNGSAYLSSEAWENPDTGGRRCVSICTLVSATAADYIQITAYQISGVTIGVNYVNFFVQRIS